MKKAILIAALRISLGFIFLWAFIDKAPMWFGGGSPTEGFLKFGTSGPFAEGFKNLSGSPITDALYMAELLGVGVALILGIGIKIASVSGSLMMLLIYMAAFPPEHNPIIDEHIIYILSLLLLKHLEAGKFYGFGKRWQKIDFVKRHPVLV